MSSWLSLSGGIEDENKFYFVSYYSLYKNQSSRGHSLSLFEFGASSIPRAFYSAHAQLNREFDRRDSSLVGVV